MPRTHSQAAIAAAFRVFDTDGNGTISADELKAILTRPVRGQPPTLTAAQVDELITKHDANSDGVLSLDEFARAWAVVAERAKVTLDVLTALVVAPADETFSDLVPGGAGCRIAKTEERAVLLAQLEDVKRHVARRCAKEGWLDYHKQPLTPERASLYEVRTSAPEH